MLMETQAPTRLECPLCAGRRTRRGTAFRRGHVDDQCCLCRGAGSIERSAIQDLCNRMQHVANAMQAGDADRAAEETRTAVRLARRLLK